MPFRSNYDQDGLFTYHSDAFRTDRRFRQAYERGLQTTRGNDPMHEWRIHIGIWCAVNASKIPGDFVECGTNVGFMASSIMQYLDWNSIDKRFYLIDTFTGPVLSQLNTQEIEDGRKEFFDKLRSLGGLDYTFEEVKRNFAEWKKAIVIKGVIPDILDSVPASSVAFLHIDLNCALPEVAALRFFWPKLSPGAHILLDDFAYSGFEPQRLAMSSVADELGVTIAYLPSGQGLLIKSGAET